MHATFLDNIIIVDHCACPHTLLRLTPSPLQLLQPVISPLSLLCCWFPASCPTLKRMKASLGQQAASWAHLTADPSQQ